ncbi:unnamed protein product [Eruca vesicaria subsp. sativa]|uniref:Uncharacterized protein n=1 Tax=Eruca vesicaria subsp. sativa TaxID=29727 RepID=A0ABC8LUU7_ERUVS|nr:unnamed protein product [Eruca vesicaria subsp. sativa]
MRNQVQHLDENLGGQMAVICYRPPFFYGSPSPQDTQKEYSYNHEELMLTIECLKMEKEKLRLLNQRMIGKELDGMCYSELLVLSCAIQSGMLKAEEENKKIKSARQVLVGI